MKEMHIDDNGVCDAIVSYLSTSVVMLQTPKVFVLLAQPSFKGVELLNTVKSRLPNKNYSTALGSLSNFYALADLNALPTALHKKEKFEVFNGAIVRISVGSEKLNTSLVKNGTHQGLLIGGRHREVFCEIEEHFSMNSGNILFGGKNFYAPFCTSANVSGDPSGPITNWDRAWRFGKERQIPLVIRSSEISGPMGSYPIFWIKRNSITLEREGLGQFQIIDKLPVNLKPSS